MWFRVVQNLVLDVLLGMFFIDGCIRVIFQSGQEVVPWHSRLVSVIPSSPAVGLLFSDVSVSNVQLAHAAKSIEGSNDKDEKQLHLFRVSIQTVIPPFMEAAGSVRCNGQGLLLVETPFSIINGDV